MHRSSEQKKRNQNKAENLQQRNSKAKRKTCSVKSKQRTSHELNQTHLLARSNKRKKAPTISPICYCVRDGHCVCGRFKVISRIWNQKLIHPVLSFLLKQKIEIKLNCAKKKIFLSRKVKIFSGWIGSSCVAWKFFLISVLLVLFVYFIVRYNIHR